MLSGRLAWVGTPPPPWAPLVITLPPTSQSSSNHPPTIMVHVCHSTSTCYSPSICYSPTPPSSPSQVEDTCIFEAILIHTMAGPYCHAGTVTIFHSQITLTVHIYTTSTYISNRHWTGLELLTLSCMLAWAPLSSNILIHSTFPSLDAHISAVHPVGENGISVYHEGQT